MAYKRLGKVHVTLAATWTTIYTVPVNKMAVVATLHIINLGVADTTINVAHADNGVASEDYILYDEPLSCVKGNNHISIQLGICMADSDKLRIEVVHADVVTAQAWGEEVDD